ncbi:MAG: GDSL-type esterase/lipase family protein [Hespellia sp.]|nr:GDSL-type esterase/lipase family protein [Hespellia sp.]
MSIVKLVILTATICMIFGKVLNRLLPRKEKANGKKPCIVCIGDSITFGAGVRSTREKDCWVRLLEDLLEKKYQVLNYGISSATLLKDGNLPYRADFLKKAIDIHPALFILMLGTNDSKPQNWNAEKYEAELSEMIELLKKESADGRLIVMTPPFAVSANGKGEIAFAIQNDVIRDEIRPIVLRQAKNHQVTLVDLYQITEGHPEYYADGVHPNVLGNQVIAKCLLPSVQSTR